MLILLSALAPQDAADVHLGRGYEALKQERYEEAVGEFRAALKIDSTLVARARFPLAVALFQSAKFSDARTEFEGIQQSLGEHPNTLYYLGRIDLLEKKYSAALRSLTKAASDPPFPDTAYYLGIAHFKQGNFAAAEKWLDQAPQDSATLYQLALVYRAQRREPDAKKAFAQSQKLRARASEENQLKVACADKLEHASREEAHAVCNKLYDPKDAERLASLGMIYGQHGDLESAIEPLRRAAELSPNSPQMQYNLAFTYYQLNRFSDALAPVARAVQRWPDVFQLNFLHALILLKQQNETDAWAPLARAHQLNPQDETTSDLLFRTAMVLGQNRLAANNYSESVRYFTEALKLRPTDGEAHAALEEARQRSRINDR